MTKKYDGPDPKLNKINSLTLKSKDLVPPKKQIELFRVEKQIEHDGVEMGVLDDGTPYLSESGLARMCGIDRKVLNRLSTGWSEERLKPRGRKIDTILKKSGYARNTLFLRCENNGVSTNAYPEKVCLAVLDYYAFEADIPRPEAINAFRVFARSAFKEFIYKAVGYKPSQSAMESWRHFHDRVSLIDDAVPDGYFCVFREMASMIIPMIKNGVTISEKIVPDISVGMVWSKYWNANELEKAGKRVKFSNFYPNYYPQAKSNPQRVYAYPDAVLPTFRAWLKQGYIPNNLPRYLNGQSKKGTITPHVATTVIEAFAPKSIN